jgi:hypothetical protein
MLAGRASRGTAEAPIRAVGALQIVVRTGPPSLAPRIGPSRTPAGPRALDGFAVTGLASGSGAGPILDPQQNAESATVGLQVIRYVPWYRASLVLSHDRKTVRLDTIVLSNSRRYGARSRSPRRPNNQKPGLTPRSRPDLIETRVEATKHPVRCPPSQIIPLLFHELLIENSPISLASPHGTSCPYARIH